MRDGVGAAALRLALYRVDGEVVTVDIGLTLPTRNPAHVARLVDLKLERIVETIDAGFGFEALGLTVTVAERMEPKQAELASAADDADRAERCAALIDSLRQRLGPAQRATARAGRKPSPRTGRDAMRLPREAPRLAGAGRRRGRVPFSCCRAPSRPRSSPSCPKARPSAFAGAA